MSRAADAATIWAGGLAVGLTTVAREPVLGLKRILLLSSYWLTMEFAYVCRQLRLPPGSRVLDVGSRRSSHWSSRASTDTR